MCENFKTIPWVLCTVQLILFERVKIGSHKNWNLGSSLHFSETILISFVMLKNGKRHFVIRNAVCDCGISWPCSTDFFSHAILNS